MTIDEFEKKAVKAMEKQKNGTYKMCFYEKGRRCVPEYTKEQCKECLK